MDIQVERKNKFLHLVVAEERVDGFNADQFQQKLIDAIEPGVATVTLDCSRLNYISSAGLRALLIVFDEFSKREAKLALHSVNVQIRQVFEISGFSKIIPMYATRDDVR